MTAPNAKIFQVHGKTKNLSQSRGVCPVQALLQRTGLSAEQSTAQSTAETCGQTELPSLAKKRPNHWELFPDSRSRGIKRQSCQLHLESPRAPAPSHYPTSVNALRTRTWSSQSHPDDISAVFCSQVVLKPALFLSFRVPDSAWSSTWESSVLHSSSVPAQESAQPCLFPSHGMGNTVTGMLLTPKAGQLLLGAPCPWGLTPAPHHCVPNTQRHQAHTAFLAVTLQLNTTLRILVQGLTSGHYVGKWRFLHQLSVQWAGSSTVLLFLRC